MNRIAADAFRTLLDAHSMTHDTAAQVLGVARPTVSLWGRRGVPECRRHLIETTFGADRLAWAEASARGETNLSWPEFSRGSAVEEVPADAFVGVRFRRTSFTVSDLDSVPTDALIEALRRRVALACENAGKTGEIAA